MHHMKTKREIVCQLNFLSQMIITMATAVTVDPGKEVVVISTTEMIVTKWRIKTPIEDTILDMKVTQSDKVHRSDKITPTACKSLGLILISDNLKRITTNEEA